MGCISEECVYSVYCVYSYRQHNYREQGLKDLVSGATVFSLHTVQETAVKIAQQVYRPTADYTNNST
jgi:hypothetical protein